MSEIKAVIFDCFGVLTSDGFLSFCARHFSDDTAKLEQARYLNRQVDSGAGDWESLVTELAALAEIDWATARQHLSSAGLNQPIFDFIEKTLRPAGYKIGLLSNVGANWPEKHFSKDQLALFDAVVLSYQLGVAKPDALMYETAAARLGSLPEECLFIDDQPSYCQGAETTGMAALQFMATEQTLDELSNRLNLSES